MPDFDLAQTLDCGQAFRWKEIAPNTFEGVAGDRYLKISRSGEEIILHKTTQQDYDLFWKDYFDLDRDYGAIKELLGKDDVLRRAMEFAPGIRVLNQQPWEALCSFIISQNNNISRIKGIIDRLCSTFGEEICEGHYSFPTPEDLAQLTQEDLAPLRCGFRARYILDAARKVSSGEVDLQSIYSMNVPDAQQELCKIVGVGPKVAQCTLLFGFGKKECFPIDVWIKRAMDSLFPDGLPDYALSIAGIAQQYIFHYVRLEPEALGAGIN